MAKIQGKWIDNLATSQVDNDSNVAGDTAKKALDLVHQLNNQYAIDNGHDFVDQGIVVDNGVNAYYPSAIYDSNSFDTAGGPRFKAWYSTGSAIKVISSYDGITWGDPVTVTGLVGTTAHHVHVAYDRSGFGIQGSIKYKIWYWNTAVSNLLISTMRYAESADGIVFSNDQALTQDSTYKIITGNSGDWNAATWGFQKVFYNGNAKNTGTNPFDYSYIAYYDANTGTTYQTTGLGYSIDGKNWFNRQSSPVINRNSGDALAWDFYATSFGTFTRDINGYHCWYSGGQTAGGHTDNFGIGYAFSPDGLTWTKDSLNPIFTCDDGITYRDERCYTPSVVDDNSGKLYMFYTAQGTAQTGRKKLGLATISYNSNPGRFEKATTILNDSSVTGSTIKDALNNIKQYTVEKRTISATEASNKYLVLAAVPTSASLVTMSVVAGPEQENGIDFEITIDDGGKRLSWSGLGLDGVIESNDVFVIRYY